MNWEALVSLRFDVAGRHGDEWTIRCPVHDDSNPSARVNVRLGLWHCHACGDGGRLADLIGEIPAVAPHIASLDDEEERAYPESWLDRFTGPGTDAYWRSRGLSRKTILRFRLGADDDVPLYPVRDATGKILGVVRRVGGERKYLYPAGVRMDAHLFGAWEVGRTTSVVLTEGAIDAMALWEAGAVAVAQYGSRLSEEQVEVLRRMGVSCVVLAYDDDPAGDRAARGWWSPRGRRIPGALDLLRGFVVESVDWSILRGEERPRRKSRQLDPASISVRQRRELLEATRVL